MPSTETSPLGEERISRRAFITEQVTANIIKDEGRLTFLTAFMLSEGISSVALEHPEWDMDNDLRTRAEWAAAKDVI